MSDRHMHITSFLYDEDPARLIIFETEARAHFQGVYRIVRPEDDPGGGRVDAFVFYSRDGGGHDDLTCTLPEAAASLAGILDCDVEIVSAWEGRSLREAQRVWPVPGRK